MPFDNSRVLASEARGINEFIAYTASPGTGDLIDTDFCFEAFYFI
jgi:hypothetical protein